MRNEFAKIFEINYSYLFSQFAKLEVIWPRYVFKRVKRIAKKKKFKRKLGTENLQIKMVKIKCEARFFFNEKLICFFRFTQVSIPIQLIECIFF